MFVRYFLRTRFSEILFEKKNSRIVVLKHDADPAESLKYCTKLSKLKENQKLGRVCWRVPSSAWKALLHVCIMSQPLLPQSATVFNTLLAIFIGMWNFFGEYFIGSFYSVLNMDPVKHLRWSFSPKIMYAINELLLSN